MNLKPISHYKVAKTRKDGEFKEAVERVRTGTLKVLST